jgi:hypothetical protein
VTRFCDAATVIPQSAVVEAAFESATFAVKLDAPATVGEPEIVPVLELSVSPAGRVPCVTLNVYGGTPPLAVSDEEYATPTVPLPAGQLKVTEPQRAPAGGSVMVTVELTCTGIPSAPGRKNAMFAVKVVQLVLVLGAAVTVRVLVPTA